MLRLNSKNLAQGRLNYLAAEQQKIDVLLSFTDKVAEAASLWKSKNAVEFDQIKAVLKTMCVCVEICVYCENNEGTDVDHIYPKKLYPEKAFVWENYALSCGKCNSHLKKDKFKIFNPQDSIDVEEVTLPPRVFLQPANDDALFLSQRIDDPMEFLELDLINRTFVFIEKHPEGTRNYERAKYTIELLKLNARGALKKARESAALFFIARLETYVNAKKALSFPQLIDAVDDFIGSIDEAVDFLQEKNRILASIKRTILNNQHPTVWKEMIRQRVGLPKTNQLLNEAPEALVW